MRRRDEVISCDIQELEASLRQQEVVREQETPAEEIARLKEASMDEHINMDREVRWHFHISFIRALCPWFPLRSCQRKCLQLLLLFNESDGTDRRRSAVCLLSEHTDLHKLLNASGKGHKLIKMWVLLSIYALNKTVFVVFLQLSVPDKVLIPERYVESEPEEVLSPEQEADKQRKVDRIKALIVKNRYLHHHGWTGLETSESSLTKLNPRCCNVSVRFQLTLFFASSPSMQNVLPSLALSPEDDTVEEVTLQEKEKLINISYELAAEASKRSKLVAGTWPQLRGRHRCAWRTDAAPDLIGLVAFGDVLVV